MPRLKLVDSPAERGRSHIIRQAYVEHGTHVPWKGLSATIALEKQSDFFRCNSASASAMLTGLTLFSHGTNDLFETTMPLLVDHQTAGPLRHIYRYGAKQLGYDKYTGDFAYSSSKLILNIYAGTYGFQKINNRNTLATVPFIKKFMGHRDAGRLYHYVSQDFALKWSLKPTPMKVIFVGSQLRKAKIELYDGEYKFNGE